MPEFSPVSFSERFDEQFRSKVVDARVELPGVGSLVESWSGYALARSGNVLPYLIPGVVNGRTNINANGAVRLWFKPRWSSASTGEGTGPGHEVSLMELSVIGQSEAATVWSLRISADGSVMYLSGGSERGSEVLFKVETAWRGGEWHQVVLNYSSKGTAMVLDGEFVAEGGGVLTVPSNLRC